MGSLGDLLRGLGAASVSSTGSLEIVVVAGISLLTLWARRALRRWPSAPGAHQSGALTWRSLAARLAVPLLATGLFLLAHALLRLAGQSASLVLGLAILLGMFVGVRSAVYVLARWARKADQALGPTERTLGWVLWGLWLLLALDWLQPGIRAVDAIAIPLGGTRVSLLDAIRVVVVVLLFVMGASYVGGFIERRLLALAHVPIGVRVGTAKVTRVALVVLAALIAFNAVGVNLTALTVMGGAVGVGLGFGLQRIASNFVSGFILLGDRSIRPGDVITIGTRFGVVRELRARYVVVRDRDGVDTLIPNENIITSEVINWSYADRHIRLKLPVQISYRDDPRQAMALMERAAAEHARVEAEPAPVARILGFGENGIDLELRFWIDDPEDGVMNVRSDLYLAVWDAFKAAQITIPYPQRDVRIAGDVSNADRNGVVRGGGTEP